MRGLGRAWVTAIALSLGLAVALAFAPAASASGPGSQRAAAQRLAEMYAPITMVREQDDPPCGTAGEQYEPTRVEIVLGNEAVTLYRDPPDGPTVALRKAPTAADIAGLNSNHYLDLPGDPLGDTCVYARDFARILAAGDAPATTYAHIAREPGQPGFALQYWFYWYFNQFNDLHESDWEGMQISFDAATPAAALDQDPNEIILFQHAGGERASWTDPKVQKEGTHPIVYPAAGSHATFYDSTVYVENGQHGSGVGCDDTSAPVRRVEPEPLLLPNRASERGPYRWLSYEGRWGQKEAGFNNGPAGPATKTVWREPFTWMAAQRTTSPRLPGGSIVGPQVTGLFCGAVSNVTGLMNLNERSPAAVIATLGGLVIALGLFLGLTSWGPIDLARLRVRRSFGQIVRSARRFYGRHWRVLVGIAALALPIVGGTNLIARWLGGGGIDSASGHTGFDLALADLFQTLGRPVAAAIVAAIVIVFVRDLAGGDGAGFRAALVGTRARVWRVVGAQLLATLGILLLALTVVGIPWAIWKLVGWAFVQQEVLFTDKPLRAAFRGSSDLVRGRWWHAVRTIVFFRLVTLVGGPVLTFALIFTPLALTWIDLLGSLVFALLIPFVTVGETLLYFDLQARAETEPEKPRRSWNVARPRRFGRVVAPGPSPASTGGTGAATV